MQKVQALSSTEWNGTLHTKRSATTAKTQVSCGDRIFEKDNGQRFSSPQPKLVSRQNSENMSNSVIISTSARCRFSPVLTFRIFLGTPKLIAINLLTPEQGHVKSLGGEYSFSSCGN